MTRHRQTIAVVAIVALAFAGCGHAGVLPTRDAPYVEVLRLRISKARHAIEETRLTIAQSRGADYLPELYLRLGELLSEEARYHYQVAFEREQQTSEALHVPQVRLLKEQAIGVYDVILRDFPQAPIADRVLFNIAQERRELGQFDNPDNENDMVGALTRLTTEYPQSPLRFEALLVLGDYNFDRSLLDESERFYDRITSVRELTPVTDIAHYKLAWVWVNRGDCAHALTEFELAIRASRVLHGEEETDRATDQAVTRGNEDMQQTGPQRQSNQGIDVRRAAITDLAYCYAQERQSDQVLTYLRDLSHDRQTYVAGLARVARRYATTNEATGLLLVARELLRLAESDDERLDNARSIHTALRRRATYAGVGGDVTLMIGALERYTSRISVTTDSRRRVTEEFEVYTRDLLTRAQSQLEDMPEARRVDAANDVARGYQAYLAMFTRGNQRLPMIQNAVDTLTIAGRDFDAGVYAMMAADLQPEGTGQKDSLYDAVVHFMAAIDATGARSNVERVVARASLRRAGQQLLRYEIPAEQERRVKLAIAKTYYDEGQYREAIDRLEAVAYEFPQSTEATAAINLVLDSYNTLNDYEGLQTTSARFLAARSPATVELRGQIGPIAQAAEQRMLDEVSLTAAGEEGGNIQPLIDFAEAHQGSPLGERALINAFVAARAIGDTNRLYQLGGEISRGYPQSSQLPGILATLGQTAIARFEYTRAVGLLRLAAQADASQRVRLLVAAGDLSEQLGQEAAARELLEAAVRAGADPHAQTVPLARYAQFVEHHDNPERVISALSSYQATGGPDISAIVGLAQAALGRTTEAETTLQNVLSAGASASPDALARAHLGMGEVLLATANQPQYATITSLEGMEEFITVVDATQQEYLQSVQQGNPVVGAVALGRIASLGRFAARRLRDVNVQGTLSPEEQRAVAEAIQQRATVFEQTAREAVTACANQAWTLPQFNPAVRSCLAGRAIDSVRVSYDTIRAPSAAGRTSGLDELRRSLARNPDDLEGLRNLGMRYLEGGDAQSARLVFQAAVDKGGGPVEQNLLGIASSRVGDISGALEALTRAATGGLEMGRQNLARLLRAQGLGAAATTALQRIPQGRPGGMALEGGGGRGRSR